MAAAAADDEVLIVLKCIDNLLQENENEEEEVIIISTNDVFSWNMSLLLQHNRRRIIKVKTQTNRCVTFII